MPGVPKDGVKVIKYNETRTVTFTGKAPSLWPGFDSSHPQVYAGYVVLDRDPSNVKFTSEVDDGVLRLFFPRCDGSLHFLSPLNPRCDDQTGQDEIIIPAEDNISFILHSPLEPFALTGGKPEHINPHLLSGVKGVYEHKIVPVDVDGGHLIYVRLDVPGTCRKANVIVENSDGGIVFTSTSFDGKGSRFGEAGRQYFGVLQPACICCRYQVIKNDITDGVMRLLVRKSDNTDRTAKCHFTLPPAAPGGDLQSASLNITGLLPGTIEWSEFP